MANDGHHERWKSEDRILKSWVGKIEAVDDVTLKIGLMMKAMISKARSKRRLMFPGSKMERLQKLLLCISPQVWSALILHKP